MTPYLDPLCLGRGVKVRIGTKVGVKGGGGVKVGSQGLGQGWDQGRGIVKVKGVKGGGHGRGSRGWSQGAVGISGGRFEMKRKCSWGRGNLGLLYRDVLCCSYVLAGSLMATSII